MQTVHPPFPVLLKLMVRLRLINQIAVGPIHDIDDLWNTLYIGFWCEEFLRTTCLTIYPTELLVLSLFSPLVTDSTV